MGIYRNLSPLQPWVPTNESSLRFWLDPTNNASITQSGGTISNWVDLSVNAYAFAQAVTLHQPTVTANALNGLQGLTLAGSQGLTGPANMFVSTGAAWTFACAGKITAYNNNFAELFLFSSGSSSQILKVSLSNAAGYNGINLGIGNSSYALCLANMSISTPTTFKLVISYIGSSPTSTASYQIDWNGISQTITTNSGGWGTQLITGSTAGVVGSDLTYGMSGVQGDFLFFNAQSSALAAHLNTYLGRWGV